MATNGALRTPAVEDYTKAIFSLESRHDEPVPTKTLAERLEITPGSVSAMLKRLDELGLITHVPYRGVRLTPDGRRIALEVIRHHRLLESYLSEVLGMPWDRVHAEAEVLEHVLSDDLEELIAAKLGHPTVDPHGDPIPSVEYDLDERETTRLDELPIGATGRFVRVSDSDPEMLRYLAAQGIALGDELVIVERQPFGGPLFVRFGEETRALGDALTRAMRVEQAEPAA
jgi:DtxR family transcriptional regulator, Mn-dependent transcriptional regulator